MSRISSLFCLNVISDLLKRSIFYSLLYDVVINKIKNVWKSTAVHFVTITKCLSFSSCVCVEVVIFCPGRVATFCVGNFWAHSWFQSHRTNSFQSSLNDEIFDEIQHLTCINLCLKMGYLYEKCLHFYT